MLNLLGTLIVAIDSINLILITINPQCFFLLKAKGKPFTNTKLHKLISDLLADNNECEDDDAGIEHTIEIKNLNMSH